MATLTEQAAKFLELQPFMRTRTFTKTRRHEDVTPEYRADYIRALNTEMGIEQEEN